ncbi:hypothetical protein [Indioceanicola profundi]|uniref:hypothetical protein n=1 Tax=Indioceanicola profundi TaxID=2220096 RepID=UPI001CEC46BB|nr:hypothetical protein [Indioceanicola profundi]
MGGTVDTAIGATSFFWDVVKDGMKVNEGTAVSVLPEGLSVRDIPDWQGPVTMSEFYSELSFLFESEIIDFTLAVSWLYNGTYIGNFHLTADGSVQILSSLNVSMETGDAYPDANGVFQLPYSIHLHAWNITGGNRRTTIKAVARGDGGGMSIA